MFYIFKADAKKAQLHIQNEAESSRLVALCGAKTKFNRRTRTWHPNFGICRKCSAVLRGETE